MSVAKPCSGVRVGARPIRALGAVASQEVAGRSAAKPSREWTPMIGGFGLGQTYPTRASAAVVKRSFRRACRRATAEGQTTYRGRTL